MARHPEALKAAKILYRKPPGVTWDEIAAARVKYGTDARLFPIASIAGAVTAWGVPCYAPTVAARTATLLEAAAQQRRQLGTGHVGMSDWARAGLMNDSLFLVIRARRLRLAGLEHEKARHADEPRAVALMQRLIAREMGVAA